MFNSYVINVAKAKGKLHGAPLYAHHFRIVKDNYPPQDEIVELFAEIKSHFPAPQYSVTITGQEETGRNLNDVFEAAAALNAG